MEAFLVEFKMLVIAESTTDAMSRVRVWSALASAAGYDAGSGRVSRASQRELEGFPVLLEQLEKARVKAVAPTHLRERAVQALATHLDGSIERAGGIVGSIEQRTGELSIELANALIGSRKPSPQVLDRLNGEKGTP